jgi:hypothetical protein
MSETVVIPIRLKRMVSSDVPEPVRHAARLAAERGEPLVLRYLSSVYKREATAKNHVAWSGLSWNLEVPGLAEAELVQAALGSFFLAVQTGHVQDLQSVLDTFRVNFSEVK